MAEPESSLGKPDQPLPGHGLPEVSPDLNEQDYPQDNIVPTQGYRMLPVVGLGGSAGSIPALQKFFSAMSVDSGMAFVVILHLSPEHESMLDDILGNWTSMRVVQAEDNQTMEANTVYVIPPGKFLRTSEGNLKLFPIEVERGRRMAVDIFFRSLADTHGAHATAIVLSGADGDGALGLKRVKERGGLTVSQDPSEAENSGMPHSAIATGMVDWVLPVEEMPSRLLGYYKNEALLRLPPESGPAPASDQVQGSDSDETAFREILTFLRIRTARDFSCYKRATILRRISRRMQVTSTTTMAGYLSFLRQHPGEAGMLQQDLLISVTNFFRDREAFLALEKQIPGLFANKAQGDAVRVWSAACATGEEAFSLVMMLLEHAATLESPATIQVFATDLAEDVVASAREGFYPSAIAADVSEDRLRRFFTKEEKGYRVRRELRECVLFAVHDVLKDAPFSRMDLITCRNLLIYLAPIAQKRALDTAHFALRPGGLLFLGTSESVDEDAGLWTVVDKKFRIFRQNPSVKVGLPVPLGPETVMRAVAAQENAYKNPMAFGADFARKANLANARASRQDRPEVSWEELHFKLIERFSPPSLIVTRDHDIVHVSQNAGRLLHFSIGEPSLNLLRVINPMVRVDMRAALFRAAQVNDTVEVFNIPVELEGRTQSVDIRVCPADEVAPDHLLVVLDLHDIDEQASRPALVDEPAVRHLERESEMLKRRLRDVIEQYEASAEELKAGNEELQAMNEELRSSGEEIETSREELQSINEELTTVNHELKGKVDELATSNSDFVNLMAATGVAIIFLDRNMRITRFTPQAVALFNLIESDLGRPLSDITHRLSYPGLKDNAESVLSTLVPLRREVFDGEHWFLGEILPYRTADDRILGVVLSFVDITQSRSARNAMEEARKIAETATKAKDQFLAVVSHELRTPLTPVTIALKLLGRTENLPVATREILEMIDRNLQIEMRLIDDLLDVSRIVHGKLEIRKERIDLHVVLLGALSTVSADIEAAGQYLETNLQASHFSLLGDSARLQQAFWNLLKNASKFTAEGGLIRVTSRNQGHSVVVEVTDNGAGFSPENRLTLFDSFSQTSQSAGAGGGLGLGLAIAKAVVDAHDGTIEASSPGLGLGATFTITLPVS